MAQNLLIIVGRDQQDALDRLHADPSGNTVVMWNVCSGSKVIKVGLSTNNDRNTALLRGIQLRQETTSNGYRYKIYSCWKNSIGQITDLLLQK